MGSSEAQWPVSRRSGVRYVPAAHSRSGQVEIDEAQAVIVRRIFSLFADGYSPRAIADALNGDRVPSPGAVLYRGEVVWARTRWKPSAANSSKRLVTQVTDSADWIRRTDESLRIIGDELWQKVHAVQTASNPRRDAVRLGVAKRNFRQRGRYLLSGVLVCGTCGCNFIGDSAKDYVCPAHTVGSCANNLRFRRGSGSDRAVYTLLQEHLFSEEAIARGKARITAAIKEQLAAEEQAVRKIEDTPQVRALDAQAAVLRSITLDPAARSAALAAIERSRSDLIASASGSTDRRERRAQRLLEALPTIVATFQRLAGDALKVLTAHDTVAAAGEALRRLLMDGRITLSRTPITAD